MNLFGKIFKTTFLFIVLSELLSFFGYLLPDFNKAAFLIIVLLALILSLYKLEYGVWIVLAELFIGSKGYLFFFEHNGLIVSIRIALWLVVMAVWLGKVLNDLIKKITKHNNHTELNSEASELSSKSVYGLEFLRSSYFPYFFILFLFIAWGAVNGILNHNEFSNVFFDFNGWLYFALVFPVYSVFLNSNITDASGRDAEAERKQPVRDNNGNADKFAYGPLRRVQSALQIFAAAIIWLSVKTFFLLFIFSHNMAGIVSEVYRWTRVSGLGEITLMQGGFYRVFFQSHIFVLIGFFIFLILLSNRLINQTLFKGKKNYCLLFIASCLLSVILITFSRSFWVGLIFGLFFCFFVFLFFYKISWKNIFKITGALMVCGIISFALIAAIVKFPYPSPTGGFSTSEILSERASKIRGESALSSRWALLPKLWGAIKDAPVAGRGFGATITYKSSDPRVLETSPTGEYTTYAFEWGWLGIWLKLGLFGMLAYLVLIGKIIIDGWNLESGIWNRENIIIQGLVIGLAVVAVVSIFSPYMNHPLGIGYLILVSAMLEDYRQKTLKVKKEGP